MADIPGLIEGAWEGVGLGHQFLRHVERCRLLIHVVDVSGSEGRDPKEDFAVINRELRRFNAELADRPMLVAGNKCDLATEEQIQDFRAFVEGQGYAFFPIMAPIREGVDPLMNKVLEELSKLPPIRRYEAEAPVLQPVEELKRGQVDIQEQDGVYFVKAPWLLKIMTPSTSMILSPFSTSSGAHRDRRHRRPAGGWLPRGGHGGPVRPGI